MLLRYVISEKFDYQRFVPEDSGKSYASLYLWDTCSTTELDDIHADVLVLDTHVQADELEIIGQLFATRPSTFIFVQAVDPHWYMRDSAIFQFALKHAGRSNFGLLSVYSLGGWWANLIAQYSKLPVIHAPYLYQEANEVALDHTERYKKILLTGNIGRPDYPLRAQADLNRRLNPFVGFAMRRLKHPGYFVAADGQHPVRSMFVETLAKYRYAFVCPSQYKLEFLKYREIAYAGCVPCGELPPTLWDCPDGALLPWRRNVFKTVQTVMASKESELMALRFRQFMRQARDPSRWRLKVQGQIERLLGLA